MKKADTYRGQTLQRFSPFSLPFLLLFIPFLAMLPARKSMAQQSAFDRISVSIQAAQPLSQNDFTGIWSGRENAHLNITTPYHAGELQAGVRYTRFVHDPELSQYASFHSAFIYAGWGIGIPFSSRLSFGPAFRFGTHMMRFDRNKVYTAASGSWAYKFDRGENEFAYELLGQARYRFSDRWSIVGEVTYNRTLTYHPIGITLASLGISLDINSPEWFKKAAR